MNSSFGRGRGPALVACVAVLASLLVWAPALPADDDRRFIKNFITDAAIVENGWVEGQVQYQDDAPFADDRLSIGPVLAFSPLDKLEVGSHSHYVDADVPGGSESGLGDTTLFGKWQFFHNPVQFTVGVELFLPTGDEDKLLGTGEFDFAVFGAVRKNLPEAILTGHLGFRRNDDASVGSNLAPGPFSLDGKTSTFLGGGVLLPLGEDERFALSGELTIETERYESMDSAVQVTAGGHWFFERFTLRGGIGVGLDDGSPDLEATASAVFHY